MFPIDQRSHCCRMELEEVECPACKGLGYVNELRRGDCLTCEGTGENKDMCQCSGCGTPYQIDDLRL